MHGKWHREKVFLLAGVMLLCSARTAASSESGAEAETITQEDETAEKERAESKDTEIAQDGTGEEEKSMGSREITIIKGYKGVDDTNPIMTQRFGADPYAMVYGDRVYIYMTADAFEYDSEGNIAENTYGKIHQVNVLSTDDMVNFTDHGTIDAASGSGIACLVSDAQMGSFVYQESILKNPGSTFGLSSNNLWVYLSK